MNRYWTLSAAAALALGLLACSNSPLAPDPVVSTGVDGPETGTASALDNGNGAPVLDARTQPPATDGDPYPIISGQAPLTISFNLCNSSDPDQDLENPDNGDTLNWQFHFGDGETDAFDEDGTFNPDFEQFCRTEHTYGAGSYVATLSVTDKHLQDQGRDVSSFARVTKRFTIQAVPEPTPTPTPCLGFLPAPGCPV